MASSRKVVRWSVGVIVALVLVVLVMPMANSVITRGRLAGLWHVDGTFADWRFGMDGSYREEALISTGGKYELLSGGRIRITNATSALVYKYRFDNRGLLLEGDGHPMTWRLTPKD